jgi:hypothetical protein
VPFTPDLLHKATSHLMYCNLCPLLVKPTCAYSLHLTCTNLHLTCTF